MVVSSVTPLIAARCLVNQPGDGSEAFLDLFVEVDFFFRLRRLDQLGLARFDARADQHVHGGVAAIVEDHVGEAAIRPLEDLVGVVPVLFEALALHREDGHAGLGDGGGGVILRREDVARGPAHIGAEVRQRFDQHAGLDRHVERAGDARAFQRLRLAVFRTGGHEARHFGLCDHQFFAAVIGERNIRHLEIVERHLGTPWGKWCWPGSSRLCAKGL